MEPHESAFCRSAAWRLVSRRLTVPWALRGASLYGEVLEIGGGAGFTGAELVARFPGIRLTITDLDAEMVERARTELGARAEVVEADAADLPFPDEAFDTVLSFLMLHHVEAWRTALSEAARVLKPGGLLLGYDVMGGRISHARHPTFDELDLELSLLPLTAIWIRPSFGLFMRFKGTKR